MGIKPFDIRRLKPFHRQGAHLPGTALEEEDKIAELDPKLKPEEHSYVNHYVSYADVLLDQKDQEDQEEETEAVQERPSRNVVQMPPRVEEKHRGKQFDQPKKEDKVA